MQQILASKIRYGKLYYQAQWKGWDPDPTWYLAENFRNAPDKLIEYHRDNPDKAGPPVRLEQWKAAAEADGEVFCEPHRDDNLPAPNGRTTRLRKSRARK